MITLTEFFELNKSIIYFVYGLIFFILGSAIILQTRKSSRLDLARSLRWLAAFGVAHGFHEWGDLFIPIQATYLSPQAMRLFYILHLLLLASSFTFLFEFGFALLYAGKRGCWLHWLTAMLFLSWFMIAFFALPADASAERPWTNTPNALARYMIGFPGGILAAYGLRQHTLLRIKPLNVPNIVLMLQVAGVALGAYALFAGLIPPPVNFFPGNVVNQATFTEWVGIPPLVFRSLTGLVMAISLIRALEIFDVVTERHIEALEQHQIITAERERLARELHDGAIQKVYTAGLLVESAARLTDAGSAIGTRLSKSVTVLNDAIADLRRNLAELHAESPMPEESLSELLHQIAEDPRYTSMVSIHLNTDVLDSRTLSPVRASHAFSIVNEALANTVRHARAQNVEIRAIDRGTLLQLEIQDDGIGIPAEPEAGYGLRNMRDRARLLNGTLTFGSSHGTTVTLLIPWVDQ